MKFSLFKNDEKYHDCFQPDHKPKTTVELVDLALDIKTHQGLKSMTEYYREQFALHGRDAVRSMKFKFPYMLVPCLFTMRNNSSFVPDTWNEVAGFDIDRKDNPDVDWDLLVDKICTTPEVVLCFKSTSFGLKGLIKIDGSFLSGIADDSVNAIYRKTVSEGVYPHFENLWGVSFDNSQAVLSQPMFINHDPDIYCVPDAVAFKPKVSAVLNSIFDPNVGVGSSIKEDFKILNYQLDILSQSSDKTIYETIMSVTKRVAQFIKGGLIEIPPAEVLVLMQEKLTLNPNSKNKSRDKERLESAFKGALEKESIAPITKEMTMKAKTIKALFDEIRSKEDDLLKGQDIPYVMIGDDFYEIVKDPSNPHIETLQIRSKDNITIKTGSATWKGKIRQYTSFVSKPSLLAYEQEITSEDKINGRILKYWNTFQEPPFSPEQFVEGAFPTIQGFVDHVFGTSLLEEDQREIFWDYLQTLITEPTRKMPTIVLVSKDREAAKSVLARLLAMIFGESNVGRASVADFMDTFNGPYASKFIVDMDDIEPVKDPNFVSKLKPLITEPYVMVNDKFSKKYKIQNHLHFVITSNEVLDFMKVQEEEVRFWIRELLKFPKEKVDPQFYKKMESEIPHMLHWLMQRTPVHADKGRRTRFDESILKTNAFRKSAEHNKSNFYWEIKSYLEDLFENDLAYAEEIVLHKDELIGISGALKFKMDWKNVIKSISDDFGNIEGSHKLTSKRAKSPRWFKWGQSSNVRGFKFTRKSIGLSSLEDPTDLINQTSYTLL
jgi:hypothetical protein